MEYIIFYFENRKLSVPWWTFIAIVTSAFFLSPCEVIF